MKKKYLIPGVILFLIVLYFVYANFFSSDINSKEEVRAKQNIVNVEKKSFTSNVELDGTTKIKNEQKLRFNTVGKVVEVKFEEGGDVRMGETIATIDSTEVLNEIEKQKLTLNNSRLKLKKFIDDLNNSGIKNSSLDIDLSRSELKQKEADIAYLKTKNEKELENSEFIL